MSSSSGSKAKKFTLKNVLDGFRGTGSSQNRQDTDVEETLRSEHFHVTKTVRHGFPFQPTALAFDSVQHLLAIGNRTGCLRIIGQPGVDCCCSHSAEVSINQILFLINEGALVTVTSDDHLHLWDFRHKQPRIDHSLKFQREKISKCHLPFQSKWLYVGTERGNVHMVNIESFTCSGYIINWNKAIELSRKTHPGPVVHLSDNPADSSKLLIGYESGAIVFWDLKTKSAEYRYNSQEALRSISWHNEGKQFMCSHSDGSLSTWNVRTPHRSLSVISPHAKMGQDGKLEVCKPIAKVEWRSTKTGEAVVIFSGGMSYDRAGRTPSITVIAGKNTTVLEMEHNVVDFVSLCDTPWANDFQDPYAIVVLLQNDLVVIDLSTPGYPCFENPYPMDLHESPVTACQYYANCPMDIIPALYSTGKNQKKTGFSEKQWPIKGGIWGARGTSYPEIIITGHADGSLKFWDASSVTLQFLYKLKTAKVFEKPKKSSEEKDDDPFAIQNIFLCLESRMMCVAGPTHCILFRFSKQEASVETVALEFPIVYEVYDELDSPDFDFSKASLSVVGQNSSSVGSYSSNASDNAKSETVTSLKVRGGSHRWGPGFLPDLVCMLCWVGGEPQGNITVMTLNSSYGILAFGNESGLAIVDYMQKACLLNLGTPDLYGSMDPYQRAPRSPRSKKSPGEGLVPGIEDCKSPTVDQSSLYLTPTHGSDKSGESSPPSPLTPNSITGGQAPDPNISGIMTPETRTHQPAFRPNIIAPTNAQIMEVSHYVINHDVQSQQLKDHFNAQILTDSPEPLGSSDIAQSLPYFFLTAPLKSLNSQSPGYHQESKVSPSEPRTSSEALNPFDEDYFKEEDNSKTNREQIVSSMPKALLQSKNKCNQQKALVHQPALDLPPSPNNESSTSPKQDSSNLLFSFSHPQWDLRSYSPFTLTPLVFLPRSVSEMSQINGRSHLFYKSGLSENPAFLCPSSSLKPKSISTGDIPTAQHKSGESTSSSQVSRQKGTGKKKLSGPESIAEDSDKARREAFKKSSSDSQISLSDKTTTAELTWHASESQSKNWFMNKIRRRSKKKKKGGGEMEAGEESISIQNESGKLIKKLDKSTVMRSDSDLVESSDKLESFLMDGTFVADEGDCTYVGTGEVRSPESNKKFFSRVSLKMKSFGSRKCSDEDKDFGSAPAYTNKQKSQERYPKVKIEVLDLTDDTARKHSMRKMYLSEVMQSRKSVDKTDGSSFSRSRSSSISSLDNVSKEAIQCLVFADSYTRKQDNETSPCLWVGTSLGSVIVIVLILQPEQRLSQPVIVSPSGSLYRMKGAIVCMSFLDFKGSLIQALSEQWKDNRDSRDVSEKMGTKTTSRQMSVSSNFKSKISPPTSTEINNDRQFAIICSEKQARVILLPSQTCAFKAKVTETSFVVRAEIVRLRESVCMMCYVANGHIMAFSLPSLKPLFDADFLPLTDYRVARTFCFSNSGHAMFLCSPTEIQKITYSAEISENLNEMLGDLFLPKDTPEAPKQGFLKSLFGGGMATLDREELFGEASGKASKSLTKHIPGPGNIQYLQQLASTSGNEFSRTRLLVTERGEKLGELEDRSAQMMNTADQFSSAAHGVMLKYKDKKWYQF